MELLGQKVIVTGGASGFGLGIVKKFLNNGAKVVIADQNKTLADEQALKLGSKDNKKSGPAKKSFIKRTIAKIIIIVSQDSLAIKG